MSDSREVEFSELVTWLAASSDINPGAKKFTFRLMAMAEAMLDLKIALENNRASLPSALAIVTKGFAGVKTPTRNYR